MNFYLPQLTSEMHVVIVIPCFNEEQSLFLTCASLGFGIGINISPDDTVLIIVNNNSTDKTASVAERIKLNSPKNTVIVGFEIQKGFVPARHCGILLAKELAQFMNWNIYDIFILQGDADTIYSDNYISLMRLKAKEFGGNNLIEACVDVSHSFKNEYQAYIDLCDKIDNKFVKLFSTELSDDNVVDDKAVGYWLSDYFTWGGHQREYDKSGDEIYAETTRLYIRARANGAKRVLVDAAHVFHSARKILREPLLHLATAGFPRETQWNIQWQLANVNHLELGSLCAQLNNPTVLAAISIREMHLIALFCALPLHINNTLGKKNIENAPLANILIPLLPNRSSHDLLSQPSIFITDVFELIKDQQELLRAEADKYCSIIN